MRPTFLRIVRNLVLAILLAPALALAGEYKQPAGPRAVETLTQDWTDAARQRTVPVKIYYPKDATEPCPVIIFSHGLGGSRDGYAYLGQHWASYGYVSVHLQHVGSDTSVWQGQPVAQILPAMRKAAVNPQNALNRPRDVTFAIDQLQKINDEDGPLHGRLDLKRLGMAGHSFGAYTTLAAAGERFFVAGKETSLGDPRIKAAIPMSSPVPKNHDKLDDAFAGIKIPCLHMTGTRDTSPINDTTAAERRLPYDHTPANADQYLITFTGGDHMVFSGRGRKGGVFGGSGDSSKDAIFQDLIRQSTTAFWDAYLRDDANARQWLSQGEFKKLLADNGTFEQKLASPSPAGK